MARTIKPTCLLVIIALVIVSLVGCSSEPGKISEETHPVTSKQNRNDKSVDVVKRTEKPAIPVRRTEGSTPQTHQPEPLTFSFATKKLSGYKTPAEYLTVASKYFPKAIAAVCLPIGYSQNPNIKYPLVIAFGGAGECSRPPKQGALAWIDYYKTDEAVRALANNHLIPADLRGLATKHELQNINNQLLENPYQGLILVCPYSPPLKIGNGLENENYEMYLIQELIPALKLNYRVNENQIGVDGVSMGGARSMYYGFKYPGVFRSVGSIQAAVGPFMDVYEELMKKNQDVLKLRSIQLVTSNKDPMQNSVYKMHNLLRQYGIPHKSFLLTGPHDYIFNQGPGAIALLMFHDLSLRRTKGGPTK